MIVQYASDLHLECSENGRYVIDGGIESAGDVLVLAGDIVNLFEIERYDWFWDWCSKRFELTIFVPGNHDYYGSWSSTAKMAESFCRNIRKNVLCCSNCVVPIGRTDFVCSTLWSRVLKQHAADVEEALRDFKEIYVCGAPLTVADFNGLFDASFRFVKRAVETSKADNIVVATHHVPSMSAVAERRKNSPVASGFATELSHWIASVPIRCWIFGHSHDSLEAEVGNVRLVSNQLGMLRSGQPKDFKPAKTFEI